MLHTSKQYPSQDATAFHVFGRVMSGTSKLDFQSDTIDYFEICYNTLQYAFLVALVVSRILPITFC